MNPQLDLLLERFVDVPRELVWRAWTEPQHLKQWLCPKPWMITECDIDLRPGGQFRFVMRGPAGEIQPNEGCFLEIVPNEKLVWTMALAPGYRPLAAAANGAGLLFTAIITMEPQGKGTQYRALVLHPDEASRNRHDAMGFQEGWGAAYNQMEEMLKSW